MALIFGLPAARVFGLPLIAIPPIVLLLTVVFGALKIRAS